MSNAGNGKVISLDILQKQIRLLSNDDKVIVISDKDIKTIKRRKHYDDISELKGLE